MLLLVSGATGYERDERVGHLIVPGSWNDPWTLAPQPKRYAFDNGAFGGGFDAGQFVGMLEAYHPYQASQGYQGCLFATAPDVIYKSGIGDAAATLKKWPFWAKLIRGLGMPPAFVAQDGLRPLAAPWDEMGCLFIGGSTAFKESVQVRDLCLAAKARGIWVHWGRVNGKRRYELALKAGADSIDGTGFSMFPDTNIPLAEQWRAEIQQQPELL